MAKWLIKSEPKTYSIDDFARDKTTQWNGVRNYQARNFLQAMRESDEVLFYHSNAEPPAIVGVGEVAREAYPDTQQFDSRSEYFDAKATKEKPIWFAPDLSFVSKFPRAIPLEELRKHDELSGMALLKRGSRLSVQPISDLEWDFITALQSSK